MRPDRVVENVVAGIACWRREHPSPYEAALRLLLANFPDARFEEPFGRYCVDAFMPSHNLVFEADSSTAHVSDRASGREEARDLCLMAEHGILAVVHLGRKDLQPSFQRVLDAIQQFTGAYASLA